MIKNKWTILLTGFLALIIIATFTVENIYYDSLPTVEKIPPSGGVLRASYSVNASVVYGRQERTVRVENDFSSISLLLNSGAKVWEGLPIYSVSLSEVRLAIKSLEVSIFELQMQNEELMHDNEAPAGQNSLLRELNLLEIEVLKEKMEKLKFLYENEGIAYADHSGYIYYSVHQKAPVQSGQKIATISSDTGERFIKWQMPLAEGAHMLVGGYDAAGRPIGGWIEVTLQMRKYFDLAGTDVATTVPKDYEVLITKIEYNRQGEIYEFTARLIDGPELMLVNLMMEDGAAVQGICRYSGYDLYSTIIPTEAIKFDSDLNGTVFVLDKRERIYGDEYYVRQVSVQAIRILNNQTVLRNFSPFNEIIIASDKPLAHNMAVKITEPMAEIAGD